MVKTIGILTSGGDSPGLNAAIRGVGKAAIGAHGMHVIGYHDGFRGLVENRSAPLSRAELSGILTVGGTILGTSRDKPHRMPVGKKTMDMTDVIVETYRRQHLDALVCIGGGGTQKNAKRLADKGLNIVTLPKTIDNDVEGTDITFGFDTALGIATDAIDRLHSTAHSHHRIIVVEVMGHNAGWLALGAGIAGGADVILIPEIPYEVEAVAEAIRHRSRTGSEFSIVAVSEGAMSREEADELQKAEAMLLRAKQASKKHGVRKARAKSRVAEVQAKLTNSALVLSQRLEQLTGLESRVTILGHLQRGGTPSAADRLLATRLGTACADYLNQGVFGVMIAARGEGAEPVPLEQVVGRRKIVPMDHPWIRAARNVGVCLGDS
ncbi:MAG TPA: ATP-dependent 6-phosphofructokinase [Geminicoccaceae bacterium]|nr:ATP-dependent 6-phosphofructokinase [Geminicoccaceae bacterium]